MKNTKEIVSNMELTDSIDAIDHTADVLEKALEQVKTYRARHTQSNANAKTRASDLCALTHALSKITAELRFDDLLMSAVLMTKADAMIED